MLENTFTRLTHLLDVLPPLLSQIPDENFSHKPAPHKWSKKEMLGHLIDSAANNHQRFVRAQFEQEPYIVYDTDNWVLHSRYDDMVGTDVITFWVSCNRLLVEVIKRIPEPMLERKCWTNEPEPVALAWLIEDYVRHMEHHLRQIVDYE